MFSAALHILQRHTAGPVRWPEVRVGLQLGFLSALELQTWLRARGVSGPGAASLLALPPVDDGAFEGALREACLESEGRVPFPGDTAWQQAQDRWRLAWMRELLSQDHTPTTLARAVEALFDQLGCPEDMLSFLHPQPSWRRLPPRVDPYAATVFLGRATA